MGENVLPPVINDGRLAARIMVNTKIREVIGTVIRALDKSNKEKIKQLAYLASDPTIIKEILGKKHILAFMDKLRDLPIVTRYKRILRSLKTSFLDQIYRFFKHMKSAWAFSLFL